MTGKPTLEPLPPMMQQMLKEGLAGDDRVLGTEQLYDPEGWAVVVFYVDYSISILTKRRIARYPGWSHMDDPVEVDRFLIDNNLNFPEGRS